jgi:hypothetical protein
MHYNNLNINPIEMIELLVPEMMIELLNIKEDTHISLYMPTFKSHPEKQQDPAKFRELVKELEGSLLLKHTPVEVKNLLEPFYTLAEEFDFWQHTERGLSVFRTKNYFKIIGLQTPVDRLALVADSFHTKPLRKYLQTLQSYQILGISLNDVHFYEGNRHSLVETKLLPGVPKTIQEALGDQLTQKYLSISSGGVGAGGTAIHHGHGSKSDEIEKDTERFFTVVSKAVAEHYSEPSGLPLILAALPEHHNLFQRVSNNSHLLPNGIMINPKSISIERLKALAWEIIEPEYFANLEKLAEQFNQSKANRIGSDTIEEIGKAAAQGRIDTLLLESDRVIFGKIDRETGAIETSESQNPQVDDVLDDIGELVVEKGGKVVIVPVDKMPTFTGVAAIFRY